MSKVVVVKIEVSERDWGELKELGFSDAEIRAKFKQHAHLCTEAVLDEARREVNYDGD